MAVVREKKSAKREKDAVDTPKSETRTETSERYVAFHIEYVVNRQMVVIVRLPFEKSQNVACATTSFAKRRMDAT